VISPFIVAIVFPSRTQESLYFSVKEVEVKGNRVDFLNIVYMVVCIT